MLHVASLPIRRLPWPPVGATDPDSLVTHEWLVTNGLGGYASGTIAGVITRRYHGLLIAALGAPLGRTVMLSHVAEQLRFPDGRRIEVGGRERTGDAPDARGTGYLVEFRLEGGLPVWRYDIDGVILEKRAFLPYMQNTVDLMYELVSGADRVDERARAGRCADGGTAAAAAARHAGGARRAAEWGSRARARGGSIHHLA